MDKTSGKYRQKLLYLHVGARDKNAAKRGRKKGQGQDHWLQNVVFAKKFANIADMERLLGQSRLCGADDVVALAPARLQQL